MNNIYEYEIKEKKEELRYLTNARKRFQSGLGWHLWGRTKSDDRLDLRIEEKKNEIRDLEAVAEGVTGSNVKFVRVHKAQEEESIAEIMRNGARIKDKLRFGDPDGNGDLMATNQVLLIVQVPTY